MIKNFYISLQKNRNLRAYLRVDGISQIGDFNETLNSVKRFVDISREYNYLDWFYKFEEFLGNNIKKEYKKILIESGIEQACIKLELDFYSIFLPDFNNSDINPYEEYFAVT